MRLRMHKGKNCCMGTNQSCVVIPLNVLACICSENLPQYLNETSRVVSLAVNVLRCSPIRTYGANGIINFFFPLSFDRFSTSHRCSRTHVASISHMDAKMFFSPSISST